MDTFVALSLHDKLGTFGTFMTSNKNLVLSICLSSCQIFYILILLDKMFQSFEKSWEVSKLREWSCHSNGTTFHYLPRIDVFICFGVAFFLKKNLSSHKNEAGLNWNKVGPFHETLWIIMRIKSGFEGIVFFFLFGGTVRTSQRINFCKAKGDFVDFLFLTW